MGIYYSRIKQITTGKKHNYKKLRLLMLGLNDTGKTQILYKLKIGENVTTIPTIGFNVERIDHNSTDYDIWDIGGQEKLRALWKHYYSGTQCLIWVMDLSNSQKFQENKDVFLKTMSEKDIKNVPVLIIGNKEDKTQVNVSEDSIFNLMGLQALDGRPYKIIKTSVNSENFQQTLNQGLDWIKEVAQ